MLYEIVGKCIHLKKKSGLVRRNLAPWLFGKPYERRVLSKELFYLVGDAVDAEELSPEAAEKLGYPLAAPKVECPIRDWNENTDCYWFIPNICVAAGLLSKLVDVDEEWDNGSLKRYGCEPFKMIVDEEEQP